MLRKINVRDRRLVFVASMLATFGIVRMWLHIQPETDFNVGPYNVHHLFTGVVILAICGIPAILSRRGEVGLPVVAGFAVGLALVLDEWVYLIVTDGSNAAYVRLPSLIGGAAFVAAACAYALWLPKP